MTRRKMRSKMWLSIQSNDNVINSCGDSDSDGFETIERVNHKILLKLLSFNLVSDKQNMTKNHSQSNFNIEVLNVVNGNTWAYHSEG